MLYVRKQKGNCRGNLHTAELVKQGWGCREYHLLRSNPSVKKGCLSASCAVRRFAGSYFSNPCKRSMKSPADWSTFCITRFWSLGSFITAFMLSREVQPSGQFRRPFLMYFSEWRLHTRINEHTTLTRASLKLKTTLIWIIDMNILCPLKHMVWQRSKDPLHHSQMFQVFMSLE